MANQKTAILYIFMILKTTSSFPLLQYDRQVQSDTESVNSSVLKEPHLNYQTSNKETTNNLSRVNSTSTGGPRFSTYAIIGMSIGGVLAVVGILALPAVLGFTAGGIAATSTAAAMMSSSAVASGGGVAAGSMVALLQSAGVLGVTASTGGLVATASAGTIGASVGYGLGYATEKFSQPVAVFFKDTYNTARNETVVFFTSNSTTSSWNSFTNWTNQASFKIKNGTVETWEKARAGTVDAWKTLSNWTTVNTAKVINDIASWRSSSAASASSGTPIIILVSVVYNLIGTQNHISNIFRKACYCN